MRLQSEGQKPNKGRFEIRALCLTLSKAFDMSSAIGKDSPKSRRAGTKSQKEEKGDHWQNVLYESGTGYGNELEGVQMFPNLPVKDRFENFRKNRS